jgi:hypothetical protein
MIKPSFMSFLMFIPATGHYALVNYSCFQERIIIILRRFFPRLLFNWAHPSYQ